ncbi:MAG TPA: O-antigen ligase family protein [Terriglobia bacterium]|nr:O-antigen ligase family protein [Terriglobia bacterium]
MRRIAILAARRGLRLHPRTTRRPEAPLSKAAVSLAAARFLNQGRPDTSAIVLLGATVVVADGLTRPASADRLFEGALQYQPYPAAYLFALLMILLCFRSFAAANIRWTEGVLLWFVLCTATYSKDFAYLKLPGIPVFVTDVVLALLLFTLLWQRHKGFRSQPNAAWLLVFFGIAGFIAFAQGLWSGNEFLLLLRDSAMVAYSLYLPVGAFLVQSWASIQRLFVFFCIGAVLSTLNGLAYFLAQPQERRFISFGIYVLVALLGVLILSAHRALPSKHRWSLLTILGCGLLLANSRTIFVSLGALLGVILWLGNLSRDRGRRSRSKLLMRIAGAAFCVFLTLTQSKAGAAFLERVSEEFVSGTLEYEEDPNAQYRLLAWEEALDRFLRDPLWGEGYGVPFVFARSDDDVRPHSTYMTVLYKMGLFGFVPLALLLFLFYMRGFRVLRRTRRHSGSVFLYVLLIGHAAMSLFGVLNLLLESPFLAAPFWLIMGIAFRLMSVLETECRAETTMA